MRLLTRLCVGVASVALLIPATAAPSSATAGTITRDRCLTGLWRMNSTTSLELLRALMPVPTWVVTEGTITTSFRNGRMTYGSTVFILTGDVGPGQTITAEASWLTEVPYRTRGGRLVTGPGQSELVFGPMTGTKDGETFTVPGPPPRTTTVPGGRTPYTCTRTTLRWPIPVGATGTTMATFRRA